MPSIEVTTKDGLLIELHYEETGTGEPVVLIHGWPLCRHSWEFQIPALAEAGYRVIAYDRRGFGDSSKPGGGYEYDTLAADLHGLLEKLDLRDVTLVGFSMGGGEVARYIANYGTDRIKKAVFAAAVPPYLYKTDDNPEGPLDDDGIKEFEDGVKDDRPAFLEDFTKTFFSAGEDAAELVSEPRRSYNVNMAMVASPKATIDCISAFAKTDFRDDLKKIDVPVLVIHGDSDQIVPFEASGKRTHEAVENSELAVMEGGPHGINVTHADKFNDALLGFLKK